MMKENLTDCRLLELNAQGLIPGPEESEEAYLKRADYCLNLREEFASSLEDRIPFDREEAGSVSILNEAAPVASTHFGIAPTWVPLFFSNRQLPFWQGGCAWIFQKDEECPTAAFLQLRGELKERSHLMGIYSRKELVAHELAHVGRMVYEEPCFEELLAYRTSSSTFRRFLGPIVKSSKESSIFLYVLLTLLIADAYLLLAGASLVVFETFFWLHLIPVALVFFALARVIYLHLSYIKAENSLKKIGLSSEIASCVLFRLTDQEIFDLSKQKGEVWLEELKKNSSSSPRLRLIRLLMQPIFNKLHT